MHRRIIAAQDTKLELGLDPVAVLKDVIHGYPRSTDAAGQDRFKIGKEPRPAKGLVCDELVRRRKYRFLLGREKLLDLFALAL